VKYFVDIRLPDGTEKDGLIAMPEEDARAQAATIRERHPDWIVEITPVDTTQA
jgi:hypothetical protein